MAQHRYGGHGVFRRQTGLHVEVRLFGLDGNDTCTQDGASSVPLILILYTLVIADRFL